MKASMNKLFCRQIRLGSLQLGALAFVCLLLVMWPEPRSTAQNPQPNKPNGTEVPVYVLAIDGDGNVYAGGDFTTAGGVSANHIAKWNVSTNSWSALGN